MGDSIAEWLVGRVSDKVWQQTFVPHPQQDYPPQLALELLVP